MSPAFTVIESALTYMQRAVSKVTRNFVMKSKSFILYSYLPWATTQCVLQDTEKTKQLMYMWVPCFVDIYVLWPLCHYVKTVQKKNHKQLTAS